MKEPDIAEPVETAPPATLASVPRVFPLPMFGLYPTEIDPKEPALKLAPIDALLDDRSVTSYEIVLDPAISFTLLFTNGTIAFTSSTAIELFCPISKSTPPMFKFACIVS